jgi:hypothetical protein
MRKSSLLVAAVGVLALIGIGTWFGVRTFTATGTLAGSQRSAPADPAILTTHLQKLLGDIALP